MFDFLDEADSLRRTLSSGLTRERFDLVFGSLAALQSVHAKAYLDADNIETFLGAVEMAELIGAFPGLKREQISELRDALIEVIVRTLEWKVPFRTDVDGSIYPPDPWRSLGRAIKNEIQVSSTRGNDWTFISFNYNVLLESAIEYAANEVRGRRTGFASLDYCIDGKVASNAVAVLKLHGSINWGICSSCGKISPVSLGDWLGSEIGRRSALVRTRTGPLSIGSDLVRFTHSCGGTLKSSPLIVPPSWNKARHYAQLENVWRVAAQRLSTAENIVIVGYSMPESDAFFRYLFALGSVSNARIRRIVVINPDKERDVEARIRSFIGKGVEKRLEFYNESTTSSGSFGKHLSHLTACLAQ